MLINQGKILSENLTKNPRKTNNSMKNYHQENWAIYPESQAENLPRWIQIIEETENLEQNANRKK